MNPSRAHMGLMAWLGVIIVVGLILTHPGQSSTVGGSAFHGIGTLIKDLQRPGDFNASH